VVTIGLCSARVDSSAHARRTPGRADPAQASLSPLRWSVNIVTYKVIARLRSRASLPAYRVHDGLAQHQDSSTTRVSGK
jgi:hypothetical protein